MAPGDFYPLILISLPPPGCRKLVYLFILANRIAVIILVLVLIFVLIAVAGIFWFIRFFRLVRLSYFIRLSSLVVFFSVGTFTVIFFFGLVIIFFLYLAPSSALCFLCQRSSGFTAGKLKRKLDLAPAKALAEHGIHLGWIDILGQLFFDT